MKRSKLMLFALGLGVAACGSTPSEPGDAGEPIPIVRLRPEPFSLTYSSGLTQPQQLVVRDAAQWKQVWDAIWRGHSPQPALPDIDFGREMVVVVARGARPTGGYSIFVDSATARADGIDLQFRSVSPAPGCGVTQALTQPVDIARIPRRNGRVIFTERREVLDCR